MRNSFIAGIAGILLACASVYARALDATGMTAVYKSRVDRSLSVPAAETRRYARLAESALAQAGIEPVEAQYMLVVDRHPYVQAALLFWRSQRGEYQWIGASPVSTGMPGSFDHFETPLGVFDHSLANPDFRAEGTFNENGVRGYGTKGMRVFDFGWQKVPKGWGDGKVIEMRLQMHATDPDALERRLGSAQSKGCIRIPATLNRLLDYYGVLDADYEQAQRNGERQWVLESQREPVPDPGRYLIVVETPRQGRPEWSPPPSQRHRKPAQHHE